MNMRIFGLIIIYLVFTSCFVGRKEITLPGKIAVSLNDTFSIYDNSSTNRIKFRIRDNGKINYGAFRWINDSDLFIGIEYFKTAATGTNQGNVVCFDLSGTIVERIYESQDGEIAGDTYLSRNDKRLLFATEKKGDIKINPLEGLSRMQSIVIMDFDQRKVTKKIENIGVYPNFQLHESPWLFDEDHFIFSLSDENKIIVDGNDINPIQGDEAGIYVCDITTDQKKLLIAGARFGICSPVDLRICYIKDQSIWILDMNDKTEKIVYKAGSKEKISNIHWAPNGKYIYLAYFNNGNSNSINSGEKLIEVSSGKEISFKKIRHGFFPYTWK
jgi:WD40 repeat protein